MIIALVATLAASLPVGVAALADALPRWRSAFRIWYLT